MIRRFLLIPVLLLLMAQGPSTMRTFPSITGTGGIVGLGAASSQYVNATVAVQGYAAPNDGGGGLFQWSATSTATADAGTVFAATGVSTGRWLRVLSPGAPFSVAMFGAKCGGQQVKDGVSSVSGGLTHTITSATAAWTAAMVGWKVVVNGAGSAGVQVDSTIVTVTPPGTLTYVATTGTAATGLTVSVYPDDAAALNAAYAGASAAGVPLTLAGQTCGWGNPGSYVTEGITTSLHLDGGRLWLGETGPTSGNGYSFEFTSDYDCLVGPGIVDGLYQTNQSVAQGTDDAVLWQHGAGTSYNGCITGGVVIQNTKGRAVSATRTSDFKITDLTTQNCGDYLYVASMGDPQAGRSMCIQFNAPISTLSVKGLTAINAAQSGILIDNVTDANFHAAITDGYFYGNGYAGLDIETNVAGAMFDASNLKFQGNMQSVARGFTFGGINLLSTDTFHGTNISINGIDSNAITFQESGPTSVGTDWSLTNVNCIGTSANHACSIYEAFQNIGTPARYSLTNVNADTIEFQPASGPACSTTNPMQQLIEMRNVQISQESSGYGMIFAPSAGATDFTYVIASDSNWGTVNMEFGANHPKAMYFDLFRVLMDGAPTYSGGATSSTTYGGTTWTNPLDSFSCP